MSQSLTDVIAEAIYTAMGEIAGEDDAAEQYKTLPEGPREEILSLSNAVLQAIHQAGYVVVQRNDLNLVVNPPAGMDWAVDQAIGDATERLSAMLSASKEG